MQSIIMHVLCWEITVRVFFSGYGGIGRRAGFRCQWFIRVGSSPTGRICFTLAIRNAGAIISIGSKQNHLKLHYYGSIAQPG